MNACLFLWDYILKIIKDKLVLTGQMVSMCKPRLFLWWMNKHSPASVRCLPATKLSIKREAFLFVWFRRKEIVVVEEEKKSKTLLLQLKHSCWTQFFCN